MRIRVILFPVGLLTTACALLFFARPTVPHPAPMPLRVETPGPLPAPIEAIADFKDTPLAVELPAEISETRRLVLDRGPLAWEARIEAIVGARDWDEGMKSRELLRLLATLPEEALERAAAESVERLPDAEYSKTALGVLLNSQTHGRVLTVLFADLLERPDAVALPALVAMAQNPAHPLAAMARENLELLLGKNFGSDWPRWQAEVRRVLGQP